MAKNTPSSVMFEDLKKMGVKNVDAARILYDTDCSYGGMTIGERLSRRSLLSRDFVHAKPEAYPRRFFRDFQASVPNLLGAVVRGARKKGLDSSYAALAEHFRGPAAQAMQGALDAYGVAGNVYGNALARIDSLPSASDADRALLYLMLFAVCGCIGDPAEAAKEAEGFSERTTGTAFRTAVADFGEGGGLQQDSGDLDLGLVRIVGGRVKGPDSLYRLSGSTEGTEVGSLSSAEGAVTDVDADVSRRHARIFKQEGRWYVIGLGSTNGTSVISGDDKTERVVERPRSERPRGYVPEPVEIFPSDTLCFGASTRYMVIPIAGE